MACCAGNGKIKKCPKCGKPMVASSSYFRCRFCSLLLKNNGSDKQ